MAAILLPFSVHKSDPFRLYPAKSPRPVQLIFGQTMPIFLSITPSFLKYTSKSNFPENPSVLASSLEVYKLENIVFMPFSFRVLLFYPFRSVRIERIYVVVKSPLSLSLN